MQSLGGYDGLEQFEPENYRFGGGAADDILHPVVLAGLVLTTLLLMKRSRGTALAALLLSAFLIPAGQQLVVGGVHVFVHRIVVVVGWLRLLCILGSKRDRVLAGGWNVLDSIFLLYVVSHSTAFLLLHKSGAAVVNQVGFVWDYAGGYFLLRYLIRNAEDILQTMKLFTYIAVLLAVCMLGEQVSGSNVFGLLGGVRDTPEVRGSRIRSQAVFQHALLAGSFAASVLPLSIGLWKMRGTKMLAAAGAVATSVMIAATACSTPLVVGVASIGAFCLWPIRRKMRQLRWTLGLVLIGLHLSMNAPVWGLIQRIDIVQGASSYHRYVLVDQFIRRWSEWWLFGTTANANWGDHTFDTANQYVTEGTNGGLLGLSFFVLQIVWCFSVLGTARRGLCEQDQRRQWLLWALGVSLFAHMTAFLGISYFDQTRTAWFALLAMICAATSCRVAERTERVPIQGPAS